MKKGYNYITTSGMANFMDFNVKTLEKSCLSKTLAVASRLGYEVVAVNHVVDNIDNTMRKKKKDKEYQPIAAPEDIKLDTETLKSLKCGRKGLRQLTRFSTVIENAGQLHKLQTPEVQAFDIIAVKPMTEKLFHIAATTLNVDIIIIEVTQKLPYPIKRPSINVALERGIYFEIQYSPAIRDSTYRKYMIANAQSLMRVCKGKNVVITSGCQKAMELRGPHDVANLGLLYGMTQEQAKAAITTNCQSLLLHAESRKLLKSTIGVVKTLEIDEKDKWILEQNNKTQVKIECGSKLYTTGNRNKPENMMTPRQTIQSVKRHADEEQSLNNVVKKHKLEKNNDQSNGIKDNKIK